MVNSHTAFRQQVIVELVTMRQPRYWRWGDRKMDDDLPVLPAGETLYQAGSKPSRVFSPRRSLKSLELPMQHLHRG